MKLKLKDLSPNPFKKEINGGKLNEKIVKKLRSNMKDLGLMGALPVFKKDNKYFLVAGHHRVEALKREFGTNHEVETTLHNYSEENVLRGMVVENLTQRADELLEVADNLNAVRKYLKEHPACSESEQANRKDTKGIQDAGSTRDVHSWLSQKGEIMSLGKITGYLKVFDNLERELLANTTKMEGGRSGEGQEKMSIEDAKFLSRLDRKDQRIIKELLGKTGLDSKGKGKLISEYTDSSQEIKRKIKNQEINIKDIVEEKIEEAIEKKGGGEKREFIPNFEGRLNGFSAGVIKLEQQVALFRKVFRHSSFKTRYNSLGSKERRFLQTTVHSIQKRIERCYTEVNFFVSKMEVEK